MEDRLSSSPMLLLMHGKRPALASMLGNLDSSTYEPCNEVLARNPVDHSSVQLMSCLGAIHWVHVRDHAALHAAGNVSTEVATIPSRFIRHHPAACSDSSAVRAHVRA